LADRLRTWFDSHDGPIDYSVHDVHVSAAGDLGFCSLLYHVGGTLKSGDPMTMWVRATLCCRHVDRRWRIVHDRASVPFDPATGQASPHLEVCMIIVTGANGQLGRGVMEQLLTRIPVDQIGLSVRNPEKASAMAERGVRVRRGDFAEPATLTEAFEGVTQVLIWVDELGEVAVARHAAAIEAARTAGARRILYTSHLGRVRTRRSPRRPITPPPSPCYATAASPSPRCVTGSTRTRPGCSSTRPSGPAR